MNIDAQSLFWAVIIAATMLLVVLISILIFVKTLLQKTDQVMKTFIEADASFKAMIDALQDVSNLQQMRHQVDGVATRFEDAHYKIASQIRTSGEILTQLHSLVSRWSAEGTEMKQAYQKLAEAIAELASRELTLQEKTRLTLERLLIEKSAEPSNHAAHSPPH